MRFLVKVGARNEQENLPQILATLERLRCERSFDLMLIDDGSTDGTWDILKRSSACAIRHDEILGISYGHRQAMAYTLEHDYDACVTLDGDGQHDPERLFTVFDALESGVDFVQCSRYHNEYEYRRAPLDRQLLRDAVIGMLKPRYVDWEPLTDALCGFWGMRAAMIRRVLRDLTIEGYGFQIELLLLLWQLGPRPIRSEVPHPAIYLNGTQRIDGLYAEGRREERMARFGIHADHILQVVRDLGLDVFRQ